MGEVKRSRDGFRLIVFDRESTEPERVVNDIMGEASWTDRDRWMTAVLFGVRAQEASRIVHSWKPT